VKSTLSGSIRNVSLASLDVLSPKLVAKYVVPEVLDDSMKAMEVAHALGIRVPLAHHTIKNGSDAYCIMDLIEGITLEEAWPKLSWFTTIRLSFQLRGFIRQPAQVGNVPVRRISSQRRIQVVLA